jgi:uncharacterized protein (TIGR02757 family)
MMQNLETFLNAKVKEYNTTHFIKADPISIPHRFSRKEDIEIAGFFAALFAWGNRTIIINKCTDLLQRMDNAPYDFIMNSRDSDMKSMLHFKHRTFNATDLLFLLHFFKHHYAASSSLEDAFTLSWKEDDQTVEEALNGFYQYVFNVPYVSERTKKHIASPSKNSTCKRLNMFLRWMVRQDKNGVDFGIWNKIKPSQLVCPVDLHVARVARNFKLIQRKATDWKTALELTERLRQFDPVDPAKYDFALFGLGVIEKF